jgi:hypothetical protein
MQAAVPEHQELEERLLHLRLQQPEELVVKLRLVEQVLLILAAAVAAVDMMEHFTLLEPEVPVL